jgi:hypothetical protein
MPVRWLVGDRNLAWIDSGVIPTSNTVFEIKLYGRIYSGSRDFANSNMCLIYDYNSTYSFALGGKYIDSNIQIDANPHLFMITGNKVYFDDIKYEVPNASYPTVSQVFIFMFNEQNNNASGSSTGGITYARVGDAYLVPFTKRNGMLDLESMTIYPNKGTGTFTETYTLPDGTPWSPPPNQ